MPQVPDIDDLERVKLEIIQVLRQELSKRKEPSPASSERWLRGTEVKRLLGGISESTLYDMRVKGHLKGSRIMGTWYYRYSDVEQMMQDNVVN